MFRTTPTLMPRPQPPRQVAGNTSASSLRSTCSSAFTGRSTPALSLLPPLPPRQSQRHYQRGAVPCAAHVLTRCFLKRHPAKCHSLLLPVIGNHNSPPLCLPCELVQESYCPTLRCRQHGPIYIPVHDRQPLCCTSLFDENKDE